MCCDVVCWSASQSVPGLWKGSRCQSVQPATPALPSLLTGRTVKVAGMAAGSGPTSWLNHTTTTTTNHNIIHYKSDSTEQLDKLLAGLDELSGTLPDLGGRTERKFPAEEECERVGGGPAGRWPGSKTTGNSVSDNNSSARTLPGTTGTARANMRSYEEDLDYALEKEIDNAMKGHDRRVPIELDCEEPQPQPYHTRYDSKPFSYIR